MRSSERIFALALVLSIGIGSFSDSFAVCDSTMFNPVTDVCWQCVLPFRMGGITIADSDIDSPADDIASPVCICGTTIGIKASFWEPARIEETVKDPYCFNLLGTQLANAQEGFLGGGYREGDPGRNTFQQTHHMIFNVWSVLDLFLDLPCLEAGGFDVAYMSEIDPTWNDDLLSFILNPEALLFGNPVTQLACMVDSVASTVGVPLSPLFWCVGSHGSAYPLTGHVANDNYVQDNALLAERMVYKQARELLLWDTGLNECGPVPMPIWVKEHYRLQMMKPIRDWTCQPLGRSSLIWGSQKNPPFGSGGNASDNFDWLLVRKKACCIGYAP